MTKPNAGPPAITDVLGRCLQQIVDTAQITQAIVAIALQLEARPARRTDGSNGLVYLPSTSDSFPSTRFREPVART